MLRNLTHVVGICLPGVCLSLKSAKTDICQVVVIVHLSRYSHFPEIDPRLRNYRSRYGAISND
ncbi:TPA: DUF2856 family protein [Escherichia coli]|nr:DUF2856 family protein [Escherichia coli]